MTTEKKKQKERLKTPVGTGKWAHLDTPKDPFTDRKGRPQGKAKYQIDIAFDPKEPEWAAFVNDITERLKKVPQQFDEESGLPLAKKKPFKRELDETEQPTGRLFFTLKSSENFKPPVFDKYARPMLDVKCIGNGSKVIANYTPAEFEGFGGGINFYLNSLQVVELVEYRANTAASFGFDPVAEPPPHVESAVDTGAPSGARVGPSEDDLPF